MKSFDEFWETVSGKNFEEILDKIEKMNMDLEVETIGEKIGTSTVLTSLIMTKSILEKYHNWLCEETE